MIQDTFITFNRPCEVARQIGDGVLYLWTIPNRRGPRQGSSFEYQKNSLALVIRRLSADHRSITGYH
jgi:hypothetical protein